MLVITAVGTDRPGLVGQFTGFLHEAGANVADSRMVNLQGRFAMIILVQGDDTTLNQLLTSAVTAGQEIGLVVTADFQQGDAIKPRPGLPFTLRVFAMDQPGIVHRVTHLLHQEQVNIEDLHTNLEPGAYSGTPLFTMLLTMTVPADVSINALREKLQDLCDSLNCDLDITSE